jgi:hypothetical protein
MSYSSFQDVLSEQQANSTANPDQKLRRRAVITSYDGLTYTLEFQPQQDKPRDPNADDRLPPAQPSHLLSIKVTADIPDKRTPEEDEPGASAEVIKARDAGFEEKKKALQDKLAAARMFEGRIYQVSQSTLAPLLKTRSDFVKSTGAKASAPALPGLN